MKVIIQPEANADLDEAADFYESQESGLGREVLQFLHTAIGKLRSNAGVHPQESGIFRYVIQGRFPWFVAYYYLVVDEARVIGVHDHRRDPEWIAGRIRQQR